MYDVVVEESFSAAHRLRQYRGHGEELHGHTWKAQVAVAAEGLDESGLACDFAILRQEIKAVIGQLDHTCLNEVGPFQEVEPSAENVARWIYTTIRQRLDARGTKVARVTVWETPSTAVSYREE